MLPSETAMTNLTMSTCQLGAGHPNWQDSGCSSSNSDIFISASWWKDMLLAKCLFLFKGSQIERIHLKLSNETHTHIQDCPYLWPEVVNVFSSLNEYWQLNLGVRTVAWTCFISLIIADLTVSDPAVLKIEIFVEWKHVYRSGQTVWIKIETIVQNVPPRPPGQTIWQPCLWCSCIIHDLSV